MHEVPLFPRASSTSRTPRTIWLGLPLAGKRASFRRSPAGQIVFDELAYWVADKLNASGLTLPDWAATGYTLRAIGVTKASALAELQRWIPEAHI
jgi:hypothetical protein